MPTSHHSYITPIIDMVKKLDPKSILDIGVGFGKWGFLFREYLDIMQGRVWRNERAIVIHGVEIYEKYLKNYEHLWHIYDRIWNADILEHIDSPACQDYDLIFASDVIEHIEKTAALELIGKLRMKCKDLILVIPMGDAWLKQGELYGNKNESHISSWEHSDLPGYESMQIFDCNNKPIHAYHIRGNKW